MVIHLSSKAADNSSCARGKGTTHSSGAGSIPRKWKGLRYKLPHINADGQPNLGYSPKAATVMLSPSGAKPAASNPTQVCVWVCVCDSCMERSCQQHPATTDLGLLSQPSLGYPVTQKPQGKQAKPLEPSNSKTPKPESSA